MESIKILLFLLVLGVPMFVGGLLVVGGGDGEFENESVIRIRRPSREVFEWVVQPEKRKRWKAGMKSSSLRSRSALTVGESIRETFEVDGRTDEREVHVTAFEEGRLFGYRTTMADVPIEVRYQFSAHLSGGQCLLKMHYKAQYEGWWAKLTEPFLGNELRGRIEEDLDTLKAKVEVSRPD